MDDAGQFQALGGKGNGCLHGHKRFLSKCPAAELSSQHLPEGRWQVHVLLVALAPIVNHPDTIG